MEKRIRTMHHAGKDVLVIDYSGLAATEYMAVAREAMRVIGGAPERSLLTVTLLTGTRFSVGTAEDIKRYGQTIRPHVKASAVVGLSAMQRVLFHSVKPFLSQEIATFDTVADALTWLAKHP